MSRCLPHQAYVSRSLFFRLETWYTKELGEQLVAADGLAMGLLGLLITRQDEAIFDTWCQDQLPFYDAVVCLDGSTNSATAEIAARYAPRLIYLHERDFEILHKTDHGLRRIVQAEITRRFGPGHWIMCCHVDEFCYHDPRKIMALAERQGYDLVSWFSPHFYPHPAERTDWPVRQTWPVPHRHRYYHWGHVNTGFPWIEDRLYRDGPGVVWDNHTHGSVRPHGLQRAAPFHPIFCHYKVIATNLDWYELVGNRTYYEHHWVGLEHRTGLAFPVQCLDDLFVTAVPNYHICDRFDGFFSQPWNLGEEFRPDPERHPLLFPVPSELRTKTEDVSSVPTSRPLDSGVVRRRRIAIGPENPAFGSWNWLGVDLGQALAQPYDVEFFRDSIPGTDLLIFIKFLPAVETLRDLRQRSRIVYCPVDLYGSAAELDGDWERLRCCDLIVSHSQSLLPYLQSYAPTISLDHHLKYVVPTRNQVIDSGSILWVGERSNLAPVVAWVNAHRLPADLIVLTNAPLQTTPTELGFQTPELVQVVPWSPESHREWLMRCRAAIDIKGQDFRAHHKPPAKALDFLASGIPLAMPHDSGPAQHLREQLGFELAAPDDLERWLSPDYALACQRFGRRLTQSHSLDYLSQRWNELLADLLRPV
ncbi:hypothetical protein GC163_24180 [bacterium]|nr:hypothetical protein [bacterium]